MLYFCNTPANLPASVERISCSNQNPGYGAFAAKDVVLIERRPVRSGTQEIRIVTTRKPAFPGVAPYNKYVDRNGDDNVVAVTG